MKKILRSFNIANYYFGLAVITVLIMDIIMKQNLDMFSDEIRSWGLLILYIIIVVISYLIPNSFKKPKNF